ncbi:hypothetical protein UlMin_039527 [Ulmus minor]
MGACQFSSPNFQYLWTVEQNKRFETALTMFDPKAPHFWRKIAKYVGGTTEEQVVMQFQILLDDLYLIESGHFPLPKYWWKHQEENNEEKDIISDDTFCIESGQSSLPKYWKDQGSIEENNISNVVHQK